MVRVRGNFSKTHAMQWFISFRFAFRWVITYAKVKRCKNRSLEEIDPCVYFDRYHNNISSYIDKLIWHKTSNKL